MFRPIARLKILVISATVRSLKGSAACGIQDLVRERYKMADHDQELQRRRDKLTAALSLKKSDEKATVPNKTAGMAGTAYALKISSEFIAAILVGLAIGALIDKVAGTSPFGLIIFLFLGFVAGVLNVLRNSGLIAVSKSERGTDWNPSQGENTPAGNAWPDDEEDK